MVSIVEYFENINIVNNAHDNNNVRKTVCMIFVSSMVMILIVDVYNFVTMGIMGAVRC